MRKLANLPASLQAVLSGVVLVSVASLLATPAHARSASTCSDIFSTTAIAVANSGPLSRTLIGTQDPILLAVKKTYELSGDYKSALELLALGISRDEVAEIVAPIVRSNLDRSERAMNLQVQQRNAQLPGPVTGRASEVQRSMTLEEFSEAHGLQAARDLLPQIGNRFSTEVMRPVELMKSAFLTGDRSLVSRAVNNALRNGEFDELNDLAQANGDNETLLRMGQVSIARFVYADRNFNYLKQGLRSLSAVTGPAQLRSQALLFDLYDLMMSPEIIKNVAELRTYGGAEDPGAYHSLAMDVLVATQDISERRLRGSTGSEGPYHLIRKRSDDRAFVNRLKSFIDLRIALKHYVAPATEAIAMLKDTRLQLEIARRLLSYRNETPEKESGYRIENHGPGHLRLAVIATLASGDLRASRQILELVEKENQASGRAPDLAMYGQANFYFSGEIIELLRAFTTRGGSTAEALKKTIESIDYNKAHAKLVDPATLAPVGSSSNAPAPKIENVFWHAIQSAETNLMLTSSLTPAKRQAMIAEGEALLRVDLFQAYNRFAAARDLENLQKVYDLMMANGNARNAVYVAIAMKAIRENQSPVNALRIESSATPLLTAPRNPQP